MCGADAMMEALHDMSPPPEKCALGKETVKFYRTPEDVST